jgi:hypothetical protein
MNNCVPGKHCPLYLSGWIPIGKKLKQWKLSTTDVCPRCGEPETHSQHDLCCEQDAAQHQWSASLQSLDRWMTRNHTQPELQIGIIRGLRAWHDHDPLQRPDCDRPGVNQTLDEQAELGCDKFVDGFIATSWMATQQSYLEYIAKKTTGKRWASRLIVQLGKSHGTCGDIG